MSHAPAPESGSKPAAANLSHWVCPFPSFVSSARFCAVRFSIPYSSTIRSKLAVRLHSFPARSVTLWIAPSDARQR